MARYPMIVTCRDCGDRKVPVPLAEMPVDMDVFLRKLMELGNACAKCGSSDLVMDQSEGAFRWYDRQLRDRTAAG